MKHKLHAYINTVLTTTCVWCGLPIPWCNGKPSVCPHCGKPF